MTPIPTHTQSAKPIEPIPTIEQLRMFLAQEPQMVDIVEAALVRHKEKLPYRLVLNGIRYELQNILCRGEQHLERFITIDPETIDMKADALKIMMTPHEVLITGETGTGKEIIAKSMIGKLGGEIKAINCGALPENLIESELFGYVRGAFTDAKGDKDGLCIAANNGVMFLDEIGDLPLMAQGKLLRAIQEKRIRPVGSVVDLPINCRFVCATHKDIRGMVESGHFRRDLYARISTLELHIKPLRERRCDVIPIVQTIQGHERLLQDYRQLLENADLDLSLNVRSLQQYVTRYQVLGRLKKD